MRSMDVLVAYTTILIDNKAYPKYCQIRPFILEQLVFKLRQNEVADFQWWSLQLNPRCTIVYNYFLELPTLTRAGSCISLGGQRALFQS